MSWLVLICLLPDPTIVHVEGIYHKEECVEKITELNVFAPDGFIFGCDELKGGHII
jgi:hypothetical protein